MATDLTYLKGLVELLSTSGVKSYRDGAIQLEFAMDGKGLSVVPKASGTVPPLVEVPIDESLIPEDLRSSEIMKHDTVLFFSAPGGAPGNVEDDTMALTGDVPL